MRVGRTAGSVASMRAVVTVGCSRPEGTVTGAPPPGNAAPGIDEAKAIAEEAFLYGLPLVMHYAVPVHPAGPGRERQRVGVPAAVEGLPVGIGRRHRVDGLRGVVAEDARPRGCGPQQILPPGEGTWSPPAIRRAAARQHRRRQP